MTRKFSLTAFAAAQCLIAGLVATMPAKAADGAPQYFFNKWTVASNCTEANAGPAAVGQRLEWAEARISSRHQNDLDPRGLRLRRRRRGELRERLPAPGDVRLCSDRGAPVCSATLVWSGEHPRPVGA